jgi:protease I
MNRGGFMKKIGLVISFNGFRDEEYAEPKKIFLENGFNVDTISIKKGKAKGKIKITADVDFTLDEVKKEDYEIIALVGGPMALNDLDNKKVYEIMKDFYSLKGRIAAICISPVILAHAGLLKGVRATVWPDGKDELIKNEAIYDEGPVVLDKGIVTGNGPLAAEKWAYKILELIGKK